MFDFLNGTYHGRQGEYVTIVVRGVGYAVRMPALAVESLGGTGAAVTVYTTMRQPQGEPPILYGFASPDERAMFLLITNVQGVGPKIGLALLSAFPVRELAQHLVDHDENALLQVKGVGSKTAQRLFLDCGERARTFCVNGAVRPAHTVAPEIAEAALMALGYSAKEARKAVAKAHKSLPLDADLETLIKRALAG